MGYKIGMPSLKLNGNDRRSKKCGSFGDVSKEALERIGRDPDIDPTRTHLNEIRDFKTTEELLEYSRKHIAEIEAKTGKKVRKDAVLMCATIIKTTCIRNEAFARSRTVQTLGYRNQRVLWYCQI